MLFGVLAYVNDRSYATIRPRKVMRTLILILIMQTCSLALGDAQPPNLIGTWKLEITFPNGESRSLRFEAQETGKGSLLLVDPRSDSWEPAKPSSAKWIRSDGNAVTFSGAVEFPIGNVG